MLKCNRGQILDFNPTYALKNYYFDTIVYHNFSPRQYCRFYFVSYKQTRAKPRASLQTPPSLTDSSIDWAIL